MSSLQRSSRSTAARGAHRGSAEFQDLNDELARLSAATATPVRLFVCECAEPDCGESLEAAISTYRATRAVPGRHLVAPGHELNGAGTRLVESNLRFSIVEQATPFGGAVGGANGDAPDKPHRVLIVDDDPGVRGLLGVNFQLMGFEAIEASNGLEGADRARVCQPDLVVTDVMMPGLDGFELAEALGRDERTRAIPIIFLSAQTEPASVARAHALGALAFIFKPFDPVALATRVSDFLAQTPQTVEG